MFRIAATSRFLSVLGLGAACSSTTPSTPPNTATLPARLPHLRDDDPSRSLVWRSPPESADEPRHVVRAFFGALTQRSPVELSRTLAHDALTFRPNHEPTSAVVSWLKRLDSLDYSTNEWADVLAIQVFDRSSARQLDDVRHFHLLPAPGEWLAVVDLPKTSPPIWGTEIQFILRTREAGPEISKLWEDFTP